MIQVPLAEDTTRDAVDDVAAALGLLLVNVVPKTDAFPAQLVYVAPDRSAAVHLVFHPADATRPVAWAVRAEGPEAEATEARWAEALRQ